MNKDQKQLARDQATFALRATKYWLAINEGKSKKANSQSASADRIVGRWARAEKAIELLLPLLDHEYPGVRCAAATSLLNYEPNGRAIDVLRRLQSDPVGLIGSAAELALMRRGLPSSKPN